MNEENYVHASNRFKFAGAEDNEHQTGEKDIEATLRIGLYDTRRACVASTRLQGNVILFIYCFDTSLLGLSCVSGVDWILNGFSYIFYHFNAFEMS